VLTQRYDVVTTKPAEGVIEIAAHLGIALSNASAEEIATQYSFEANKRRAEQIERRMWAVGLDAADAGNVMCFDGHSQLHWNHLRDGRAGAWRERANERERAILHHLAGSWLVEHGYATRHEVATDSRLSRTDHRLIARGAIACRLRRVSVRYPRAAEWAKRLLGLPSAPEAKPVEDLCERRHTTSAPAEAA
jgi:hypothetical protein